MLLALMNLGHRYGVLKKFFVDQAFRKQHIGSQLYKTLLNFAQEQDFQGIILDTPSVAEASHRFYERVGFKRIEKKDLPVEYHYPDRDSWLYLLKLAQ
ncbi:MAG: GNAT family N-acetyltransferase [Lactobacillus sp.]|nr:GNAT family N-acetyltransferase [Lactobacillus sp.]MCI1973645.1 GNAT family N-acetyltransferase [Lactobacillus sp.]